MLRLPWLALTLLGCLAAGAVRAAEYDLIISGGRVVDGTGAPWFRSDVGVRGDRIAAIGKLEKASAKRRVDATGKFVDHVATFEKLLQYSEGFRHVVVNGRVVLDDGKMTDERPGRPLRPGRP